MSNPFDQFDTAANPFDQFDITEPVAGAVISANPEPTATPDNPEGTAIGRAIERGLLRTASSLPAYAAAKDNQAMVDAAIGGDAIIRELFLNTTRLPEVPQGIDLTSPEAAAAAIAELGYPASMVNNFRQVYDLRQKNATGVTSETLPDMMERAGGNLLTARELNDDAAALQFSPRAEGYRKAYEAAPDDFRGTLGTVTDDPLGFLSFLGEVVAESVPQLAASAATTAVTRSPATGSALLAGGAVAQEYGASVDEFLHENNVSLSTPDEAAALLTDGDLLRKASERGMTRGVVIAAFEAMGQGAVAKSLFKSAVKNAAVDTGVQMGTGAGGEMAAREMAGQEQSFKEAFIEAMAEGVTTPVEVGIATSKDVKAAHEAKPETKLGRIFEAWANEIDHTPMSAPNAADQTPQAPGQNSAPARPDTPVAPAAPAVGEQPAAPVEVPTPEVQQSVQQPQTPEPPEGQAPQVSPTPPGDTLAGASQVLPEPSPAPERPQVDQSPAEPPKTDIPKPEAPKPLKRPLTNEVRKVGGVKPGSPAAIELNARGITPRTAPGLFRKDGHTDLDNLPVSENEYLAQTVGVSEDGLYISPVGIIEGLTQEVAGQPVQDADQRAAQQEWDDYEAAIEGRREAWMDDPQASQRKGWIVAPPSPDEVDFMGADEYRTGIAGTVDHAVSTLYPEGTPLTPDEREEIIDDLAARGGDIEAALVDIYTRSVLNEESEPVSPTQGDARGISVGPESEGAGGDRQSDVQPIIQGSDDTSDQGDRGRPEQAARSGTEEGGRVDLTPEGRQEVIPGAERITDKEQAERQQEKPVPGGDTPMPEGGLFDDDARSQDDLFDGSRDTPKSEGDGKLLDAGKSFGARVGRRPPGSLSPKFLRFSFNNKPSVFQAALEDAGIDPEEGRLMDVDRQIELISRMVEERFGVKVARPTIAIRRKNRFGRKVTEQKASISSREALDQLLDAYQNLQMLAATMGLPEAAIGLPIDGKGLTIELVSKGRLRGALGMFKFGNGERSIVMPGRSNSFAHEWGHALDHFLNTQVKPDEVGMLTRDMSSEGIDPPKGPIRAVTDAFGHMIWALYGDQSPLSALLMRLQAESVERDANAQPTEKARAALSLIKDIRKGKRPPAKFINTYFQNSAAFDEAFGGGGYFTDPAEMFARAFEAWVGRTAAEVSDLPQHFLTKGAWAYNDNNDTRLELTFPKGADADNFAVAMTKLSEVIASQRFSLLEANADAPAKAPIGTKTYSNNDLLLHAKPPSIGQREKQEVQRTLNKARTLLKTSTAGGAMARGAKGLRQFYQHTMNTSGEAMWAIAARQKNPKAKRALLNVTKQLAKVKPGRGNLTQDIYQEQVERAAKVRVQKIYGAIRKRMGTDRLTDWQQVELRKLLTGQASKDAEANLRGLAGDLRGILNEIWYDLKEGGVPVGYAKDYLPHIYDVAKVDENRDGFRAKAAEVYGLLFDREITENTDEDGQAADLNSVINGLRRATRPTVDGERVPAPMLSEQDEALIAKYRKTRQKLNRLKREAGKSDDATKFEGRIADAAADLEAVKGELLEVLKPLYAEHSARNWDTAMGVGQLNDFGSVGPSASFLKGRVLPKEAGQILAPFMMNNPLDLISGYAFAAARRAEYAKRFGDDNSKLKAMLEAAREAGTSEDDIDAMKMLVNAATGRMIPASRGFSKFRTFMFTYGNLSMLSFAAFTSLAESAVAGMRTGRARDSLKGLATNVRLLVRKGERHKLIELASAIGMIAPYSMETVVENRLGADSSDLSPTQSEALHRFFVINGLTPLTNFQRVSVIPVAHSFIRSLLRESVTGKRSVNSRLRDGVAGGRGKFADGELNEMGIPHAHREALLEWLDDLGHLPVNEDMYASDGSFHPAAEIYARAINRLSNEIIVNPMKTDRAGLANHPDWAAMYGIMSFIDGFTRNVLLRNVMRGTTDEDGTFTRFAKGGANVALAGMPFGILLAGHFLSTTLREALLNSQKFEEKAEDDELLEWLFERAFWRTGIAGRVDPVIQTFNGVKYERDLTAVTAGPYLAQMLQNVMTITKVMQGESGRNSKNTNTTEHGAVKAAYRLAVQPMIAFGVSMAGPASPFAGFLSRGVLFYGSAHSTSDEFADKLVGEKKTKHDKGTKLPWWETGDGIF